MLKRLTISNFKPGLITFVLIIISRCQNYTQYTMYLTTPYLFVLLVMCGCCVLAKSMVSGVVDVPHPGRAGADCPAGAHARARTTSPAHRLARAQCAAHHARPRTSLGTYRRSLLVKSILKLPCAIILSTSLTRPSFKNPFMFMSQSLMYQVKYKYCYLYIFEHPMNTEPILFCKYT